MGCVDVIVIRLNKVLTMSSESLYCITSTKQTHTHIDNIEGIDNEQLAQ
jgi:hypothetical protein